LNNTLKLDRAIAKLEGSAVSFKNKSAGKVGVFDPGQSVVRQIY
jgi:hypothetical protein